MAFNDYDDPARVKLHRQESTKMNEPHTEFSDDHTPTAYLITFRSYGTWPHGDNRGSVDRFHKGYGNMNGVCYRIRRLRLTLDRELRSSAESERLARSASGCFGLSTFEQTMFILLCPPSVSRNRF